MIRAVVPRSTRRWVMEQQRRFSVRPPVGWVRLGSLRRLEPVSRMFGFDRGHCIDRYYIERFLSEHRHDVQGHVLEAGDDTYTRQFGGDRVTARDVLHAREGNPQATIVADLACAHGIPSDRFDCIVLTQTLQHVYDLRAAIRTLYRILVPGGVLLVTVPGISQISRHDMDRWGDYWRLTTLAARRLFEDVFPPANVVVQAYGNVVTAIAFLHGLTVQDLRRRELNHHDPDYELLVTIRAIKPEAA